MATAALAAAEFAKQLKVAERTKAWWQSRWQRWWHRCHLQLPLVAEEEKQAFAFLSVHSSTLPEHWAVHTTGKLHWEAEKCTAACKPTGKHSGERTEHCLRAESSQTKCASHNATLDVGQ